MWAWLIRKGPCRHDSPTNAIGTASAGPVRERNRSRKTGRKHPGIGGCQAIPRMWKSQSGIREAGTNVWRKRAFGVDPGGAVLVPLKANFRTQPSTAWVICHDADVQATEPEAKEQARVPGPHADKGGPSDPQPASPEGSTAFGGERRLEIRFVGVARPGAGAPGRFRFPPSSRITRSQDIRDLLRRGKRKKTSHLDVFFLSGGSPGCRVGLLVPKHRQRVVDRNRLKRRLREIGRREILPRLEAEGLTLDLLIRARAEAYTAGYRELRDELAEVIEEICSGPRSWH